MYVFCCVTTHQCVSTSHNDFLGIVGQQSALLQGVHIPDLFSWTCRVAVALDTFPSSEHSNFTLFTGLVSNPNGNSECNIIHST